MLDALAAIAKALLYAGLLSSAGAVFAEATLRAEAAAGPFLMRVIRRGALLTILASIAGALILILRLGGRLDEATLSAVFLTSSGAATCLQLAGAALLLTAIDGDESGRGMRLSNAALATSSFAFSGHAAAVGAVNGLVAFLHVSAAAWWVGSLWLLRYACARLDLVVAAALVRRFSAIALVLVGALVIVGLLLVIVLVDFSREPWLSAYGRILAVKISIAALVLGLASHNRIRLTPRLVAGDPAAVQALRRMISAELVLIGMVVATTAVLTTYTSPHE